MGHTRVKFQNQRLANPRGGTNDRGRQGAGATLVAPTAATQAILLELRIPETKPIFYH